MNIWPSKKPKGGKAATGTIEPDLDLNDLSHIEEAAQEGAQSGHVFTTPAGRRFHADVVDELFDAVECANKAETHQHRRFHVRRAARILAESDRVFGR